jgi:phosphoglucomutase
MLDWQNIWKELNSSFDTHSEQLNPDFLNRCVLSASGLRFIHSGDEQDLSILPHPDALSFAFCVLESFSTRLTQVKNQPEIWLGMDARPTGPSFLLLAYQFFLNKGFKVRVMGHGPIPEVMAATHQNKADGFCYFTASHNPAGHNGFKLGLSDGAVLNREESLKLIGAIKQRYEKNEAIENSFEFNFDAEQFQKNLKENKSLSKKSYFNFVFETIGVDDPETFMRGISDSWEKPPAFLIDMNGSSRLKSIDVEILEKMGLKLTLINDELGVFAHAIVPEGESLLPLKQLMQTKLDEDEFILGGMVPDCDGDRGNLILPLEGRATALKAQETFALCALAEFASVSEQTDRSLACAVNGPSSLRLEKLLEPYGVKVARAEVGEANVLAMAQKLKSEGYLVPIAGEGSNGGNILDGATVRDPLMTLLSLLKFSQSKKANGQTAAECCLQRSGLNETSGLSPWEKIFIMLPKWMTTDAFEGDALMPVPKIEHEVLKSRYEELLQKHFYAEPSFWKNLNVTKLSFYSNEGTQNILGPGGRPAPGKGGLQVFLQNEQEECLGFLWMRGSGTEPVFRVVVDWGGEPSQYTKLLKLHRELIEKSTI